MKYLLINQETAEQTLCDKVTIDGFDYYASKVEIRLNDLITNGYTVWLWKDDCSLLGRKKVIATNNPSIEIPQVVDEVEMLAKQNGFNWENTETSARRVFEKWYKSKETHSFSEEDMIEFAEWKWKEKFEWNIRYNNWTSQLIEYSGCVYTTKELLQLWKEQQPKKIYYTQTTQP